MIRDEIYRPRMRAQTETKDKTMENVSFTQKDDVYKMPPCSTRFFSFGDNTDSNHYPEAGELLYVITREYLGPRSSRGYRGTVTNTGITPANVERVRYADGSARFRDGFQFLPGSIVTASMIVGNRNTSSAEGLAHLAALIDDERIREVGRCVPGGSGFIAFEFSGAGVDHLFSTDRLADSRVIRRMDGPGSMPLEDGPLYILVRDGGFGNSRPNPAPAGSLLPACVLSDPAAIPESVIPAGKIVNGNPILTAEAREYMRAAAIIQADVWARVDGRGEPARVSSEQIKYLADKLAACAAVVVVTE
jgi:hypothetical protein